MKNRNTNDTGLFSSAFLLTDFRCSMLGTDKAMNGMGMEILPSVF